MERYHVPEMSCGHCARTIEKAVKGVDPQAQVSVDLASKQVSVTSTAEAAAVALAMKQAGYASTPVAG
jgi:copper chaperone